VGLAGSDGTFDNSLTTGVAVSSGAAAGELPAAVRPMIIARINSTIEATANIVCECFIFVILLSLTPK
jgi:hypothetical protein